MARVEGWAAAWMWLPACLCRRRSAQERWSAKEGEQKGLVPSGIPPGAQARPAQPAPESLWTSDRHERICTLALFHQGKSPAACDLVRLLIALLANGGVSGDRARRRLLVLLYPSAAHLQQVTCPSPMAASASGPLPAPAPSQPSPTIPPRWQRPPRRPSPPMGRAGRRWGAAVPAPGSTRREPPAGWRPPDRRSRRRRNRRTTPRQCGPCRSSR